MDSQIIFECQAFMPTLERACKRVPKEFLPCYEWFSQNAGAIIPQLPHRMSNSPDTPIPLSRDAGIYIPSATRVTYPRKKYALSIHSSGKAFYEDKKPISLADGTWIIDYAAYSGVDTVQGYNQALMSCLEDGIPVGVFFKEAGGYRVLGLAFIERYNSATRMFTLHGPVSSATEAAGSFVAPGLDELPKDELYAIQTLDDEDERRIVTIEQVRREQQGKFRELLLQAYDGACAITETDVPQVLQAAHINPYRGKKSQIVTNGILLRADMHLLYDSHLVSVDPDTLSLRLSDRLGDSKYAQYNNVTLRMPTDPRCEPNRDLLAMHFEQFRQENELLLT